MVGRHHLSLTRYHHLLLLARLNHHLLLLRRHHLPLAIIWGHHLLLLTRGHLLLLLLHHHLLLILWIHLVLLLAKIIKPTMGHSVLILKLRWRGSVPRLLLALRHVQSHLIVTLIVFRPVDSPNIVKFLLLLILASFILYLLWLILLTELLRIFFIICISYIFRLPFLLLILVRLKLQLFLYLLSITTLATRWRLPTILFLLIVFTHIDLFVIIYNYLYILPIYN